MVESGTAIGASLGLSPSSKRFKMASGGEETHVGFIGGGNLARAITEGLLQEGIYRNQLKIYAQQISTCICIRKCNKNGEFSP